jgi:hypothetical protein
MIGYFTDVAEAETYFEEERIDSAAFDDLPEDSTDGFKKTAALTQAFNRIFYSSEFDVPEPADADSDELPKLQKAQAEFALYLAIHLRDEDVRKGLQAQGVVEAGVVKEKYRESWMAKTPIPPFVYDLLKDFLVEYPPAAVVNIKRDQNRDAKDKIS